MNDRPDPAVSTPIPLPTAGLHLLALCAFAFAQPLYDLLAENPEFFVARGNTAADILIFAFGVLLVPPLVLLFIEAAVGRIHPRALRLVHLVLVAILAAVIALPALKRVLPDASELLIPLALLVGAGGALAYARARGVRSFATVLSPMALVFLVSFLAFSPVSELAFGSSASTRANAELSSKPPVVVLVLDELPTSSLMDAHGEVDAERLPNFGRFADDATWYRNATTTHDLTLQAVPAMLAGRRGDKGELPTSSAYPRNLFTLLGDEGYDLSLQQPLTDLCPERLCGERKRRPSGERLSSLGSDLSLVFKHLLLPDDLRDGLAPIDRAWEGFADGDEATPGDGFFSAAAQFDRFVRAASASSLGPRLSFAHLLLPHTPWRFLPSGQQYSGGEDLPGLGDERWTENASVVRLSWQRHLLQVGFVDRLLGRLVDRLKREGNYDEALIAVVADHGVSFRPGDRRRPLTEGNFADIAGVPLFIKAPAQQEGDVDDRAARTVDLVPTVIDMLGGAPSDEIEGRSLVGRPALPRELTVTNSGDDVSISMDFDGFVRERDERARLQARLLGPQRGPESVYGMRPDVAPLGELVGSPPVNEAADERVSIANSSSFVGVDPEGSLVPVQIAGSFTEGGGVGSPLAIAVNGRIVGSAVSFRSDDEVQFSALVPPTTLREGANEVEVFSVSRDGLASLGAISPTRYEVARRGGREVIKRSDGEALEVIPGAVSGFIDNVTTYGGVVYLRGWAATQEPRMEPADTVLAFAGDRLLFAGPPNFLREDLAVRFGPGVTKAGFGYSASEAQLARRSEGERLRFFGVAGSRASELELVEGIAATFDRLRE